MSDLAQIQAPPRQETCEPGEGFWGFRLTGGPGENAWRVVDLVPYAGIFIGALPGLVYRKSTPDGSGVVFAVAGGALGLVAGLTAWLFLPPRRSFCLFSSQDECRASNTKHEASCSGGFLG
jgi:hypothetical protein